MLSSIVSHALAGVCAEKSCFVHAADRCARGAGVGRLMPWGRAEARDLLSSKRGSSAGAGNPLGHQSRGGGLVASKQVRLASRGGRTAGPPTKAAAQWAGSEAMRGSIGHSHLVRGHARWAWLSEDWNEPRPTGTAMSTASRGLRARQ